MSEIYRGIKFKAVRQGEGRPGADEKKVAAQLFSLKDDYRQWGFLDLNGGNFSGRVPGGCVIKRTGAYLENLQPTDFSKMTKLSGETVYFQGEYPPSSECRSHFLIYQKCPRYNFVFHAHLPGFTNYEILAGPNCLLPDQPYGTLDLARQIANNIMNSQFVLLQNHGVFVADETFEAARNKLSAFYEQFRKTKEQIALHGRDFS